MQQIISLQPMRARYLVGLAAALAMLGAFVFAGLWEKAGSSLNIESKNPLIDLSYAKKYESVQELVRDSTVIVRGRVVDSRGGPTIGSGVPFTDATFAVEEVLAGSAQVGDNLTVLQTGGVSEGEVLESEWEPLMKVGDSYILFLQPWSIDQTRMLSFGYYGRFQIVDGQVWHANPANPLSEDWNGRSVGSFADSIRQAVGQ